MMMEYGDEQDPAGRIAAAVERMRDYAHKATCTITELAGGGSELFAGRIGEMYIADLPFCRERIRTRERRAHERMLKAISEKREQQAVIDALVAALENAILNTPHTEDDEPQWVTHGKAALALARGGK